jgi:hypothetical protein
LFWPGKHRERGLIFQTLNAQFYGSCQEEGRTEKENMMKGQNVRRNKIRDRVK